MKRYRNGQVWDFESEMPVSRDGSDVILGLDGGTTSTVCVCLSAAMRFCDRPPEALPVLARAVAGCSNHNSVGGNLKHHSVSMVAWFLTRVRVFSKIEF